MSPLLLVGYGNTLRRDDGVGPMVVERFAGRPGVSVRTCHQLAPELAEELARHARTVFVDATLEPLSTPRLCRVEASSAGNRLGHTGDPAGLVALAEQLYGQRPAAWLMEVPIKDVRFGEGISPAAAIQADRAAGILEGMLHSGIVECTKSD